jgi:hypothetical protein
MGNAMVAAAENPAGPGPGAGIGLGLAMAGQMMSPGVHVAGQALAGPPPVPPPLPSFHVNLGGQSAGPFDLGTLAQYAAQGRISLDTLVWTQGMAAWPPAAQVPQVAQLLASSGPPPLPGS